MTDETPVERRLRERWVQEDCCMDPHAHDLLHGVEAIRLLVIFQHGPSGDAWDEWLANVDALLAKCREDGR